MSEFGTDTQTIPPPKAVTDKLAVDAIRVAHDALILALGVFGQQYYAMRALEDLQLCARVLTRFVSKD